MTEAELLQAVREAARRALVGHQVDYPSGVREGEEYRYPLCLCSGCVIHRSTHLLLDWGDIDYRTGRVKPPEGSLGMGWSSDEVPF